MEPVDRLRTPSICLCATTAIMLALAASASQAQTEGGPSTEADGEGFRARARVARPIPSASDEDAAAAATSVVVATRPAAGADVGEVLAEVPGARPYRSGTLGSFTSASLRGADIDHTAVLLGDLPLSSPDAAAFDLSTIPTALVERVVVYRGGAPVWLSQGAIGGVVQLVPRRARARELAATGTLGSFGLWGLDLSSALSAESRSGPSLYSAAGVTGSQGDFEFLTDNRTVLDPSDDFVARRRNADALQGHGLLYLRQPAYGGNLDVVALGFERVAGEPVSPAEPAFRARRNLTRALGMAAWSIDVWSASHRSYRAQVLGGASYQRARFSDLYGEVGTARPDRSDDRSARGFGRIAAGAAVAPWLELTGVGSAERDGFESENAFALVPLPSSTRDRFAGAAELLAHGDLLGRHAELRPSLRVEHTGARLHTERFRELVTTDVDHTGATYRLAGAIEAIDDVGLSASAATGWRPPNTLELFGDGALLVGNTALQPEHATLLDAGLFAHSAGRTLECSAELRVFYNRIDDLVVWIPNSLREQTPRNLSDARIAGIEAGLHGRAGRHLRVTAAATLLDTEGRPGKEIPGRSRYSVLLRPEVEVGRAGPLDAWAWFVETRLIGPSHEDPDNVALPSPAQLFVDAGTLLYALSRASELRVTVRDIFDRGGFDVRGFQLPGRTLVASLSYKEDV